MAQIELVCHAKCDAWMFPSSRCVCVWGQSEGMRTNGKEMHTAGDVCTMMQIHMGCASEGSGLIYEMMLSPNNNKKQ